jgi:carbamoyltransferase
MNVLGINYFFHDCSACIVRDGELVVALEEERFTRRKHTSEFPSTAIHKCLEIAGLGADGIDYIAVSIDPTKDVLKKLLYGLKLGGRVKPFLKHEFVAPLRKQRALRSWYRGLYGKRRGPKIFFVSHHLAHVAGSYLVSPYEHAALLSLDGSGEWSTSWLGEARGRALTCFSESRFPHSLGSFYESATEFCGFRPNYDEGKTMGLAPFGDPSHFYDVVDRIVSVKNDGRIELDLSYFEYQNAGSRRCSPKFYRAFGPPRVGNAPIEKHHEDIAAAFQKVLEDKVLKLCRLLEERTSAEHLVIAGGVALNSVLNGRILRETRFKDVYVMPAAGDGGTSIGAAYYAYNIELDQTKRFLHDSAFVGTQYSSEQIVSILRECKLGFRSAGDVCVEAAKLLNSGKIIGWFQGRMEIGPRALGGRSILANPTDPQMKAKINAEVKHREAYRPFAPSAPAEDSRAYFDLNVESPFMLKVCPVIPAKDSVLPAITHVDGSARLQTLTADVHPRYYRLLKEFGRLSGVPVLLNTSFNVMGEPIVESPLDAIRCFFSTGLDALVIGDCIVEK